MKKILKGSQGRCQLLRAQDHKLVTANFVLFAPFLDYVECMYGCRSMLDFAMVGDFRPHVHFAHFLISFLLFILVPSIIEFRLRECSPSASGPAARPSPKHPETNQSINHWKSATRGYSNNASYYM